MTWNYRVIKTEITLLGKVHEQYGIHEVYYDKNRVPQSHTENAVSLTGECLSDIKEDLQYIQSAFNKPVLFYDEEGYTEV
jgi:hypothetical protein